MILVQKLAYQLIRSKKRHWFNNINTYLFSIFYNQLL